MTFHTNLSLDLKTFKHFQCQEVGHGGVIGVFVHKVVEMVWKHEQGHVVTPLLNMVVLLVKGNLMTKKNVKLMCAQVNMCLNDHCCEVFLCSIPSTSAQYNKRQLIFMSTHLLFATWPYRMRGPSHSTNVQAFSGAITGRHQSPFSYITDFTKSTFLQNKQNKQVLQNLVVLFFPPLGRSLRPARRGSVDPWGLGDFL